MNLQLRSKNTPSFRQRFFLTIGLLTLVRIGSFIPLPYIDIKTFSPLLESNTSTTAVATILNSFSGGENASFSILSLGILPNINASIIIQLLTTINPTLLKLQKEEGEYGRRKLTDYTRYLTFFCAIIESIVTTYSFRPLIFNWNVLVLIQISLTLIAGSMIILWFSELITKDGIGNGSSILICFNIVSNFPDQLRAMILALSNQNIIVSFFIGGIFLLTTVGCIYINEAMVKIPLVSASQLLRNVNKFSLWNNSNLPLRVNQAGVMPLVFTSSVMVILSSLTNLIYGQLVNIELFSFLNSLSTNLTLGVGKIFYWSTYGILVFFFTSFYSTILLDPKDMTEQFRKNSVTIKGITPGKSTQSYLSITIKRLTILNAVFLIGVLILLNGLEYLLPVNNLNLRGFGLTSQLILVNVLVDTFRKVRNLLNAETMF
uniref:Protein translocase subunit SecY n=6 Tax=Laminariaceae TaxID=33636 RepID=A0A8K1STC3_9PHAE|nr:preprotein translocase subunit secY [Saccharina japonica]YP_009865354.1 preprotein translocase subunit secY [Saccharina latissima]YP_010688169.1 preprotein translocase subunit secY [Saccharina longissima]YP_010863418.1 preprotein translocase subunit secY [Saccharina japonica x Saccharina latissima]QOV02298.1 preprotein translocase subunit secY [Saccharina sp. ye-B]QWK44009.1 preprotein translocase subunit secY [Arthrothamnus bifidus]UBI41468.1 preprotein translocase subunit secY [Saccharin